ncbi:MAG: hypothetical protein KDB02_15425 [Acidimicrobiales bacterium]|nr:hypothetical protein [Acidimicrobiales bacterium]
MAEYLIAEGGESAVLGLLLALQWPPWWSWALALAVSVLGGICATSFAGPHLAAVGVSPDDQLLVRPVGFMRVWALSRGIDCPTTSVVDVGVSATKDLHRGRRLPGTYLPGVMTAGTFRSKDGRALWLVGRHREVLVIELTDERYRFLVLGVEDPKAACEALRAAVNRER